MQIVQQLPKSQRALRAYLNTEEPFSGFKGNPKKLLEGAIERDLTPFHLSRYLCVRATAEIGLFDLVAWERKGRKLSGKKLKNHITAEELVEARQYLQSEQASFGEQRKRLVQKALEAMQEKPGLEVLNRLFETVVVDVLLDFDRMILVWADAKHFESVFKEMANYGPAIGYTQLIGFTEDQIEAGRHEPDELKTLHALWGFLVWKFNKEIQPQTRIIFGAEDNAGWRFIRSHLFNGMNEDIVFEALRISNRDDADNEHIQRLLELHRRYAFMQTFAHGDRRFRLEASPFSEKPVGGPEGNFEVVIYPVDEGLKDMMQAVADPTFEHADGAICMAAFTVGEHLVLEEIQSDVPGLLKRKGIPELAQAIKDWPHAVIEAARIVARRNGFGQILGATPWRLFQRYSGGLHPDKARLYFDTMERLGGVLVYDDAGEITPGSRQHYYRFDV